MYRSQSRRSSDLSSAAMRLLTIALVLLILTPVAALATAQAGEPPPSAPPRAGQESEPPQQSDEPEKVEIYERIMVVGNPEDLDRIPGSAAYLGGFQLRQAQVAFDDIHRMLQRVPGINIQEEEGYGLRPNIGLRGSGAERSSRITLMEDGVLIAPAPYAAPAAYYFPVAGRMEAIEVRKGSSQVKYGPRTNGGAVNLVSSRVPSDLMVRGNLSFGSDTTAKGQLAVGDSHDNWGWLLETYQLRTSGFKHVDGGGDSGFVLRDYLGKVRYRSDAGAARFQEVELKVGYTDQDSDETYLGLTEADFRADPTRRYAGSQHDNLRADHRQLQARHFVTLGSRADLTSVVYRNEFQRDWYKIGSVNGVGISDVLGSPERFAEELAILEGATSATDSIIQRHNNREYYSQGVQTVLGVRLGGAVRHQLEVGLRYHEDQEDRLQSDDGYRMLDGRKVLTSVGAPGSQANRVADARAWALFVQDRIQLGNLGITPGARMERIELTRTDFASDDPARTAATGVRETSLDVIVPGVGVDYRVGISTSLFAGVHRGFAPPGPGADRQVEPETSVNYEIGLRHRTGAASVQMAGFYNDYANLLGADTLSSGGTGTGDQFNGGEARVYGLELGATYDLADTLGAADTVVPVGLTYTWTRGEFQSSFESEFEPWGTVEAGDEMPYLAAHQLFVSAGLQRRQWDLVVEGVVASAMRTDAGQGPLVPTESADAHGVVNLTGGVRLTDWARLQASVQNLLDNSYVVARRPAGARPGLPRTILFGIRVIR